MSTILKKGFFVTGTDTEVGKTLIASALILKIKSLLPSQTVLGFKPIVAGTYTSVDGDEVNEDLESLRLASGYAGSMRDLCPFILPTPAAPHLVAQSLHIQVEISQILSAYQTLRQEADWMVAEGAGGFLVPLNDQHDLGDVAQALNLPVILVVGLRLGCINHALLTTQAIAQRGLTMAGWVANTLDPTMPYLKENIETLSQRIQAPLLGVVGALPEMHRHQPNSPYSLAAMQFAADALQLNRIAHLIA